MKARLCVSVWTLRLPIQQDGRSRRNSTSAFRTLVDRECEIELERE